MTYSHQSVSNNVLALEARSHMAQAAGIGVIILGQDHDVSFYNDAVLKLFDTNGPALKKAVEQSGLVEFCKNNGSFIGKNSDVLAQTLRRRLADTTNQNGEILFSEIQLTSGKNVFVKMEFASSQSVIAYFTDISDAQHEDEALKMALDLCAAGYWVFDTNSDVVHFESRYLAKILTEKEHKIFKTQGLWPFFHEEDVQYAKDLWEKVVKHGTVQDGMIRMNTQTKGVRWFQFKITPQFSTDGELRETLSLFTDITKAVHQEEALLKEKETVEEHLNVRNEFLARLSHEVRTPMNAVLGIADVVVQRNQNPSLNSNLILIQSSSNKVLKILDTMLSHARLGSDIFTLTPADANPGEVVSNICKLWEAKAELANVNLRCVINDNVPESLVFDAYRYEQCLNNLLSNAVKFTKEGNIDVVLTVIEAPDKTNRLLLAVRDTGIGMTPEQQSKIFSAYTQADSSIAKKFGGTGLGMNITKEIITRMKGEISVKSQLGKGTVFAITTPMHIDTIVAVGQPQKISSAPASKTSVSKTPVSQTPISEVPVSEDKLELSNLKVLVVDDNATNHLVIKSLIETEVGELYNAKNGQEALDVLDVTDVDVVLMDIHMPTMDGIEATLAIRSSDKPWNDVLIIALTADPQYQQKKICINIGMDDALAKPVKLNDVINSIKNVLNIKNEREQSQKALAQSA